MTEEQLVTLVYVWAGPVGAVLLGLAWWGGLWGYREWRTLRDDSDPGDHITQTLRDALDERPHLFTLGCGLTIAAVMATIAIALFVLGVIGGHVWPDW